MPVVKRRYNKLGLWINKELAKRGLTQTRLAEELGISPQYLTEIMRGSIGIEVAAAWKDKCKEALARLN